MQCQRELFLSEVNNWETIAAIEATNCVFYLQKRIEKFPLCYSPEKRRMILFGKLLEFLQLVNFYSDIQNMDFERF